MIEQFLTTEQVANILQVHPFTILKFIKEGKLAGVKLGRVYRIKESAMMQFLEDRSVGSKARSKIQKEAPSQPSADERAPEVQIREPQEDSQPNEHKLFDLNDGGSEKVHYTL